MATGEAMEPAAAGGSAALRDVLRHYDPLARSWAITKDSEFWRTVAMAHELGIRGAGKRVAVIDGGFDTTLPALRTAPLLGANPEGPDARLHGTIVAALVLEVAPEAQLELYPVGGDEGVDTGRIAEACATAAARGVDIINLSIGQQYDVDLRAALIAWLAGVERWPDMTEADLDFWVADAVSRADRWTPFLDVPADALVTAVRGAHRLGVTVIAAVGNDDDDFFTPAADAAAISVGFMRERRTSEGEGREVAVGIAPRWYEQAAFVDVAVVQPLELLGSSFAAPLVAGAAALMDEPHQLHEYRRVAGVGGAAEGLSARPDGARWSSRQVATTCELYLRALNASPHRHVTSGGVGPCVACALWEVQVLIDFGLFHLQRQSFDEARRFLECAAVVAPANPHARANLGMALASQAAQAVDDGRPEEASVLLARAAGEYAVSTRIRQASAGLRVDAWKYQARRAEFAEGSANPSLWRVAFNEQAERQAAPPGGPLPQEEGKS